MYLVWYYKKFLNSNPVFCPASAGPSRAPSPVLGRTYFVQSLRLMGPKY